MPQRRAAAAQQPRRTRSVTPRTRRCTACTARTPLHCARSGLGTALRGIPARTCPLGLLLAVLTCAMWQRSANAFLFVTCAVASRTVAS